MGNSPDSVSFRFPFLWRDARGRRRPQTCGPRAVDRCERLLFAGADAGIRVEAPLPRRSTQQGLERQLRPDACGSCWPCSRFGRRGTARSSELAWKRNLRAGCVCGQCGALHATHLVRHCHAEFCHQASLSAARRHGHFFLSRYRFQRRLNWESARINSRPQANVCRQ